MLKENFRPVDYYDYKFILCDSFDKMKDKLKDYDGEYMCYKHSEADIYTVCTKDISLDKIRNAYNWVYNTELDELPKVHGRAFLTDDESMNEVISELTAFSKEVNSDIVQII